MPAVHRESHRSLLRTFPEGPPRPVDAVVVPAGRSAEHLEPAARLAIELGCPLVAMCSPGGADPRAFDAIARRRFPRLVWHDVHVPDGYRHPLLPATATPDPQSHDWRHGALSTKRNLALLLARLLRWDTIFLVDDDIIELRAAPVRAAAAALRHARAIGLTVADFPDNSVVRHANRLSSPTQDVFVGASALMIDTTRSFGFFPSIYNEDWLFLYDDIADGAVGCVDHVRQLPYDPFAHAERARAEEFGEVIAEGLMAGLQEGHPARTPTGTAFWADFLAARRSFIRTAASRVPTRRDVDRTAVLRSLRAAGQRLDEIDAVRCARFVSQWRGDLLVWREQLGELPTVADFEDAADYIGLSGTLAGLTA